MRTQIFSQLSVKNLPYKQKNHFLLFHFQRKHSNKSIKLHSWIKKFFWNVKLVAKEKKKNAAHSNWNTRDSNSVHLSRDFSVLSRYTLVSNFKFHKFLMQSIREQCRVKWRENFHGKLVKTVNDELGKAF